MYKSFNQYNSFTRFETASFLKTIITICDILQSFCKIVTNLQICFVYQTCVNKYCHTTFTQETKR